MVEIQRTVKTKSTKLQFVNADSPPGCIIIFMLMLSVFRQLQHEGNATCSFLKQSKHSN